MERTALSTVLTLYNVLSIELLVCDTSERDKSVPSDDV